MWEWIFGKITKTGHGPEIVAIAVLLAAVVVLILVVYKDLELRVGHFMLRRKNATAAPKGEGSADLSKAQYGEKVVYVKILYLRDRRREAPVYQRRFDDHSPEDVYDEALYFIFYNFSHVQPSFSWNIGSSGLAEPQSLYPWMDSVGRGDNPYEPALGKLVNCVCNLPSNVYISMSHLFNGQQYGHREVWLPTDHEVRHARLILDVSSVADAGIKEVRAFRGNQNISVSTPRRGIYTCFSGDMKPRENLRITYELETDQAKSTEAQNDTSSGGVASPSGAPAKRRHRP